MGSKQSFGENLKVTSLTSRANSKFRSECSSCGEFTRLNDDELCYDCEVEAMQENEDKTEVTPLSQPVNSQVQE
jgi:hypothetical protein